MSRQTDRRIVEETFFLLSFPLPEGGSEYEKAHKYLVQTHIHAHPAVEFGFTVFVAGIVAVLVDLVSRSLAHTTFVRMLNRLSVRPSVRPPAYLISCVHATLLTCLATFSVKTCS